MESKVFTDANEEQSINGRGNKQISDINMLLPISSCTECRKPVYQISAINGCYQWEVSHPNFIQINPIPSKSHPQCSNIAEIQSLSTKPTKSLIWITARDTHSGQVLRCEVKIGVIRKLEIVTHLRQFYVDEYQHLHTAAYDEEGNIFSSLEGLRFEWNIDSGTDKVKIVTMREASLVSTEIKKEMEFYQLHSDVLFLKGVQTGAAQISIRLMEQGYEDVDPAIVLITVTEPFVIIPQQTVYLLPTSKFQFQLAKVSLRNNDMHFHHIHIPNRQYHWNVDQDEKGDIGEDGMFISKDREGFVNVIVVDQFIANNTAESSVKVVFPKVLDIKNIDITERMKSKDLMLVDEFHQPYYKQLNLSDWENNWNLIEGHYYLIRVFLFDRDSNHSIFLTENLVFSNLINQDYFEIVKSNKIQSEFIVRAKRVTEKNHKLVWTSVLEKIKSEAHHHEYHVDRTRLRKEQEVEIFQQVKIRHPTDLVLLPILKGSSDESKNGELWQLIATGGSGKYQWSILDTKIAVIQGSGLVRSKEIGLTRVVVYDTDNNLNIHSINLEVTPIYQLIWLEDHIEIKKQVEDGVLNVIALDKIGRKFTNCTAISTLFDLKGEGILNSVQTSNVYEDLREYVLSNRELMYIRHGFDRNPQANTLAEIQNKEIITPEHEELLLHNNFGICNQQRYSGIAEGLGRVKAIFTNQLSVKQTQLIETSYAEVAVYEQLTTKLPNYNNFFTDLYSKTPIQSEEGSFHKFYNNETFIAAYGSTIHWYISGGTNFWKDIAHKYQVNYHSDLLNHDAGSLDPNAIAFDKEREDTTQFKYALTCINPNIRYGLTKTHKFRVHIRQQNLLSRHLLRPAVHQITIDVYCEPPTALKLYWAQENKSLNPVHFRNLPRHIIVNSEKRHFVLVNSRHFLRELYFDEVTQVFYNHSSILTSVSSTNENMLKTHMLRDSYDQTVAENIYDVRNVEVFNITGTVYINAIAQGYIRNYLKRDFSYQSLNTDSLGLSYEVKDQIRIEIVRNVDIQPKYKSIYIAKDNSFQFKILHGSGKFSVSINNTDVADKHYIEGERVVTLYPKKDGPIEIRVEDIEIPDSVVAISELLVSDIHRLELDAPGTLIEQGSSMDLNVTAFDLYNVPFDDDQYQYMKFTIEIEITQQRLRGLIAEDDQKDNRHFIARGQDPGHYQVIAVSNKYKPSTTYYRQDYVQIERQRVTSDVLKIEVFPLLEIIPGNLLLTPQMKYTLQIMGGPTRTSSAQSFHGGSVEIKFDVEDKKIATVDQFREVIGLEVGDTNLYYEIIQVKPTGPNKGPAKRSIVSQKTIPIRVRLVTSIDIPYNNQRTVYSNSMIKIIGILKYNQETFTHGIAPISYNWNSSNPVVLSLNLPTKSDITSTTSLVSTLIMASKKIRDNIANTNHVFLSQFNSSTVYSTGGKQGEALVHLQLAIEYPEKYKFEKNWFDTEILIRVKEKLSVEVPEFINNDEKQTHLYLMPPNTYSKIETNRRTRLRLGYSQQSVYDYSTNSYQYKDTSTPIIQLVNDEGIKTYDKYGKVTVIIEENQAFNDQVVMLNVLITDIYTLTCKDVYQTLSFPLGSSMNIPIKYQNEHGHLFANNIEGIEVGIELSHPRVVTASLDENNSTIILKAEGSGESNVVLYLLKNPSVYDVFRVRVSSVVKPPSPVQVHVGGEVKFKIMDSSDYQSTSSRNDNIIWSSNNPGVIDINQKSGEARGLSEGRAEILLSNHITAASIVSVSRVKSAQIDDSSRKNLVINTDESHGESRIRIKLFLQDQNEELTPTVQFDGITLIKQNVGLLCQSEHPNLLDTRAEINDLEGFFCIVNFKGYHSSQTSMPKSTQVSVTVYSSNPKDPNNLKNALYQEKVLTFDISYISKIKVESQFARGVSLNKDQRTVYIKVFSNSHFNVHAENINEQDRGYDLVKFKVNKTSEESIQYLLTVTVPQEITHDFSTNLILTHPSTGAKTTIPVTFNSKGSGFTFYQSSSSDNEGILDGLSNMFTEDRSDNQGKKGESSKFVSSFLIPFLIFVITIFAMINWCGIDPVVRIQNIQHFQQRFIQDIFAGRNPFGYRPIHDRNRGIPVNQYGRMPSSAGGVRSSNILPKGNFPQASNSFMNNRSQSIGGQSPAVFGQNQGYYNQQNQSTYGLNKFQFSGDSQKNWRQDNSSIYGGNRY